MNEEELRALMLEFLQLHDNKVVGDPNWWATDRAIRSEYMNDFVYWLRKEKNIDIKALPKIKQQEGAR